MAREIKEELSVQPKIGRLLFEIDSDDRKDYYFEIEETIGIPKIGGPELERMTLDNQYILEWVDLESFKKIDNFYDGLKNKLIAAWKNELF